MQVSPRGASLRLANIHCLHSSVTLTHLVWALSIVFLAGEISLLGPPLGTVDADLGFQMGTQMQGKPRDAQKQARQHAASQEARSQLGTLIGQSQPWQQACISSARLPARVPHLLSYNPCICTCSCIILRHLLALLLKVRRPNIHAYDMQPAKARLRPPVLQG